MGKKEENDEPLDAYKNPNDLLTLREIMALRREGLMLICMQERERWECRYKRKNAHAHSSHACIVLMQDEKFEE